MSKAEKRNTIIAVVLIAIAIGVWVGVYLIMKNSTPTEVETAENQLTIPVSSREFASEPGSYFPEGETRYILVDYDIQQIDLLDYTMYVLADKYDLTMYLMITENSGSIRTTSLTQLFDEEGNPKIYDAEGEGK